VSNFSTLSRGAFLYSKKEVIYLAEFNSFIQGGNDMLGFSDVQIISAYVFSVFAVILCVVYGVINWNKDT